MIKISDLIRKRAILLTTQIRFSPKVQTIKETAIDIIILQIMFASDSNKKMSSSDIQKLLSFETYSPIISIREIEAALLRLEKNNRIICEEENNLNSYKLNKRTIENIADVEKRANNNFNNVLKKIFRTENIKEFYDPFLKFLCIIFSQLGEECAYIIKGDIEQDKLISYPFFREILDNIKSEFSHLDHSLFEKASIDFFKIRDPEFDLLKWNMAQSYYIAKALGLDESGSILSTEIFNNAEFYLDTNILISALEPNDKNHIGFLTLNKACKKLNIKLKVGQVTIDELNNWLSSQFELLNKTINCIPDELSSEINNLLYKTYHVQKEKNKKITIEDVFKNFVDPASDLKQSFDIDVVDDPWFEENENKQSVRNFAQIIIKKYGTLRSHQKTNRAGLHDSLILLWIIKSRKDHKKNIWFATLDATLPGISPSDYENGSLSITLGALLQWISPIVTKNREKYTFSSIFSDIIKARLLPREKFFDLNDFLIFHALDISCKELPAEDVENCIGYIKKNAPDLDPNNSKDREKLAYEIEKFFLDPGRKYKLDLSNLERQLKKAKTVIEGQERKFEDYKKEMFDKALKSSAKKRLGYIIVLTFILLGAALYLAYLFGQGENVFQKFLNSWYAYIVALLVSGFLARIILGKKRIDALGWKFNFLKRR